MEIPIIQIGNSKGIRLAKRIIERYQLKDRVEIVFEEGYLILRPVQQPRAGWSELFSEMHKNGDDELLIDDVFEDESLD